MKATLEDKKIQYRGVIIEAETPEEAEILTRIWVNAGKIVEFTREPKVTIVVAPTPEGK